MTHSLLSGLRRILCIALFAPLLVSAAGNNIVIGQSIDLSGPNGSSGRDYVAGIKTYFDSINATGGINGKRVQYIVRDDQGQPELAAKAVSELIEKDQADYLFGGIGDNVTKAVMAAPAFRQSGHLLFAPLSGNDQLDQARVVYWRPPYVQEIDYLFSHFTKLGASTIGVAYQDTPANQEAFRSLNAKIAQSKLKLAGTIRIGGDSVAQNKEIGKLAAARPNFVIVIADTIGTGLFLKAFRQTDNETFVAGTSLVNLSTLQIEHLKMMKKFRDEAVSSLTLEGFAAAKTLTKAIQQAPKGSKAILQDMIAARTSMDLGGLSIAFSPASNHLSSHLDIALLNKSGLKF